MRGLRWESNSIQKGYELSLTVGIRTLGLDIDSCDGSIEEYSKVGPLVPKDFLSLS